ncbi:hypothetical protein B0H10DRAFT_2159626 [Mycena sp. CBHHK59/15]|nr:hypothetical protein B0H10DRAFT_2159626 [Mycena sp. CBHHK59/15]
MCLRDRPCEGKCGDCKSRNLVVSIDGTSNQFGENVSKPLHPFQHSLIRGRIQMVLTDPSAEQLTYYNCGIGTYVPHRRKTFKYWRQRMDNIIDLAIAWQVLNKIFLFGFSRGAYQVRTIAAMIERVGLVNAGNQKLIPLWVPYNPSNKKVEKMTKKFKETFARDVKVHFIGAWDTVSSIGLARKKPLPLTTSAGHVCMFRHALALDERRVKFMPEYVDGGSSVSLSHPNAALHLQNVKEVWFSGTHSDIGGGLKENLDLNLSSVPLLWMETESTSAGLRLRPRKAKDAIHWNWTQLRNEDAHESLSKFWWLIELLPIKRLSYRDADTTTRYDS